MKLFRLLLLALLITSCSKDSNTQDEELVWVESCGEIIELRIEFGVDNVLDNTGQLFKVRFTPFSSPTSIATVIVTEDEYRELQLGDTFCYGLELEN